MTETYAQEYARKTFVEEAKKEYAKGGKARVRGFAMVQFMGNPHYPEYREIAKYYRNHPEEIAKA